VRAHSGIKTGGLDEDISGRVRNLEEKFRGGVSPGRKPKDLYRAIGEFYKSKTICNKAESFFTIFVDIRALLRDSTS
jgi:hypothetical protein